MPHLATRLAERIRDEGPLPFPVFMEVALYDPAGGYYATGHRVGAEGDYHTAVHLPGFARTLARQVAECWERLDRPGKLPLVEVGAGSGRLATHLLASLEEVSTPCGMATRYVGVDRSEVARRHLRDRGLEAVPSLRDLPDAPVTGVVLGNEVVDALPVHIVRGSETGGILELHVDVDDGEGFRFVPRPPSTPALAAHLTWMGLDLDPGQEVAVNLRALDLLEDLDAVLARGFAFLLDYGDEAEVLHDPRRGSTLRAFRDHRVLADVLGSPGSRDLTASVDFTALRRRAGDLGLDTELTTQGRFLVSLGILEVMGELGPVEGAGVKNLILPGAMGERFKVLALARDVPLEGLLGLGDPFASPLDLD